MFKNFFADHAKIPQVLDDSLRQRMDLLGSDTTWDEVAIVSPKPIWIGLKISMEYSICPYPRLAKDMGTG
jgi:hypothetical protein